MCPACVTAIAITVAKTTGAGAAVTAIVARVRQARHSKSSVETRGDRIVDATNQFGDNHGSIETNRNA